MAATTPEDKARFARYWPADVHMIGKEISRFHCVYWPAFLMAAGLPLPKRIVAANGWLLFEHSKMSKSRGNIVRAETILEVLGADALRYFLLREVVFGQDGSFSFDALVQRYNADLANGYGNLVSRTLAMIGKYFDGVLPDGELEPRIRHAAETAATAYKERFEDMDFSRAVESLWTLVGTVDGYITEQAPWKLGAKMEDAANRKQLAGILATCAEAIRMITGLVYPILPESAAKIWQQLGLGDIQDAVKSGELANLKWGGLKPGTKLGEVAPVFPRAEKDAITRMHDLEQNNQSNPAPETKTTEPKESETSAESYSHLTAAPEAAPAKPHVSRLESALEGVAVALAESTTSSAAVVALGDALLPSVPSQATEATEAPAPPAKPEIEKITIDDFAKVELRVAKIIVAERIPKADKLLRLEVDLGYEQRQILAGIAEAYTPESLIGRKVVIVANLLPRKMRGLESNGMIVAASLGDHGTPVLAGFLEDVEIGARLK